MFLSRFIVLIWLFVIVSFILVEKVENRKITRGPPPSSAHNHQTHQQQHQREKSNHLKKPDPPSNQQAKKTKSWIRTVFSKNPKEKVAEERKTTRRTNSDGKSILRKAKDKIDKSGIVGKVVAFVKKDLGIGVVGPKPESKILKYGKKLIDKIFRKKVVAISEPIRTGAVGNLNINVEGRTVDLIDNTIQIPLNNGTAENRKNEVKYMLFEEPKQWKDAQENCNFYDGKLALPENKRENDQITEMLQLSNATENAWIGSQNLMKTGKFNNFENNLEYECGMIDTNGTWFITSCSDFLSYFCESTSLNVSIIIS